MLLLKLLKLLLKLLALSLLKDVLLVVENIEDDDMDEAISIPSSSSFSLSFPLSNIFIDVKRKSIL